MLKGFVHSYILLIVLWFLLILPFQLHDLPKIFMKFNTALPLIILSLNIYNINEVNQNYTLKKQKSIKIINTISLIVMITLIIFVFVGLIFFQV